MSKYNIGLKTLLQKSLSEPEFYGAFVYKLRTQETHQTNENRLPGTQRWNNVDLTFIHNQDVE